MEMKYFKVKKKPQQYLQNVTSENNPDVTRRS